MASGSRSSVTELSRSVPTGLGVGLAALLLAACSSAVASDNLAEGIVGSQDVFDTAANYRAYEARVQANGARFERCMADAGWDGEFEQVGHIGRAGAQDAMRDAKTPDDEFARTWGFGITTMQDFTPVAPDLPTPDVDDEQTAEDNPVTADASDEAKAQDEIACTEEAASGIGDGNDEYFAKIEDIRTAKDEFAVAAATRDHYADWSRCMQQSGWDYTSPLEAHRDIERQMMEALDRDNPQTVDTELRATEIEVATDTAECGGPVRDLFDPALQETWVNIATANGLE